MTLPDLPVTTEPALPAAPDRGLAPRGLVAVLSKDLFFGMRIRTSLRHLGYAVAIAQDAPTFALHLENGDQRACLGIVDFNFPVDWDEVQEYGGRLACRFSPSARTRMSRVPRRQAGRSDPGGRQRRIQPLACRTLSAATPRLSDLIAPHPSQRMCV